MRHQNHGIRKRCDCGRASWKRCAHPWHVTLQQVGRGDDQARHESGRPAIPTLQGDEESRLLAAAEPHLHAIISAAIETGMRKAEILEVEWQHVHTHTGLIDLPASTTKPGVSRQAVITPNLAAVLDMRATLHARRWS